MFNTSLPIPVITSMLGQYGSILEAGFSFHAIFVLFKYKLTYAWYMISSFYERLFNLCWWKYDFRWNLWISHFTYSSKDHIVHLYTKLAIFIYKEICIHYISTEFNLVWNYSWISIYWPIISCLYKWYIVNGKVAIFCRK